MNIDKTTKKIFIITGEPSGDYLAANLMHDIINLSKSKIKFIGIGGENMKKAGLIEIFSINQLSIIGIIEAIKKIFHVKKLINYTIKSIIEHKPDILISVDSSGFTHRVDKKLKKIIKSKYPNWKLPIVHYVAPPVWAWRKRRAKKMYKFIDKILVLFPFEKKIFLENKMHAEYVGHPIINDPIFNEPSQKEKDIFLTEIYKKHNNHVHNIITLLPGSRISEIDKHMEILKDFCNIFLEKYPNTAFIIPTFSDKYKYIKQKTETWNNPPLITKTKKDKTLAYYCSNMAIAASGTVTLELCKTKTPTIVIYRTSFLTAIIVKSLLRIKNISLINIIAQKRVVPELLQNECTTSNIMSNVENILFNKKKINTQKQAFDKIINSLTVNDPNKAAKEIISML